MKVKKNTPARTAKPAKQAAANGTAHEMNEPRPRVRTPDDVLEDWKWLKLEATSEDFAPYWGKHIAVVERKILGSQKNSIRLRELVAKKYHIDPDGIVIYFVG